MNQLKRYGTFLLHPRMFLCIIFIIQLGAWSYITFRPIWIAPLGTKYALPRDQTTYVMYIRQSKEGAWCETDPHTTRPTTCIALHPYFILLGKLAALFRIDPVTMYMASQIFGGLILTIVSYVFLSRFLRGPPLIVAIIALFLFQLGPRLPLTSEAPFFWAPFPISPLASSQITLIRIFGLPHHTLGEAFGLLVVLFIIDTYRNGMTLKKAFGIVVGTIVAFNLLAPFVVTLITTCLLSLFLWSLVTKTAKKLIPPFIIFGTTLLATVLQYQLRLQQATGNVFANEEKTWWPISQSYQAYGSSLLLFIPFFILATLLIWPMRKKITSEIRMITVITLGWLLFPLVFMPATLLSWFPLAHFRFVDGYQYTPAALLAGIGFMLSQKALGNTSAARFFPYVLVCLTLAVSFFLTQQYGSTILQEQERLYSNVYLPDGFWNAVQFFSTTGKNSNVMIMEYNGQLLGDYAPVKTFIGRTPGFSDWTERHGLAGWFFQGTRSDETASDILRQENIDYVYVGNDEWNASRLNVLYPNILTPIVTGKGVTIYEVKKDL